MYNAVDSRNEALMDGFHELFTYLQRNKDVAVYQPVLTVDGERYVRVQCDVVDGTKQEVCVRLLRWINGETVSSFGSSPEILFDAGKYLGKLQTTLSQFDHEAFHRSHMWDVAVRPLHTSTMTAFRDALMLCTNRTFCKCPHSCRTCKKRICVRSSRRCSQLLSTSC